MSDYYSETIDLPLFRGCSALSAGIEAGEACLKKAEQVSAFDADAARSLVLSALIAAGRAMSGEELVDRCIEAGLVPHDARAFGPVFGTLARQKQIETVGFAPRRKGHGTAGARLWQITATAR